MSFSEVMHLPAPAIRFVPHRPPMLQIDTLEAFSAEEAVVSAQIAAGNPLVDVQEGLAEVGLIEMLAQAYAARQGYADLAAGRQVREGYLVGLRAVRLHSRAKIGDRLRITLRTLMDMDGFALAEGTVTRDDDLLAAGTLKLWIVPTGGEAP
ncbi:MAG: 3-hydroxyacyl-ACP dehydratase [Desulfuromonadales bacterium]